MISLLFVRFAVAATWFYQGLYLKLLLRDAHQLKLVSATVGNANASTALTLLGVGETLLALSVLIGLWTRSLAWVQIALLLALDLVAASHGSVPHAVELFVNDLPFFACLGMLAVHGPGRWSV